MKTLLLVRLIQLRAIGKMLSWLCRGVLRDEYYQITFEMCEPRKELAVRRLEEIARRIQKPEALTKLAELRKLLIRQFVAVNHLED